MPFIRCAALVARLVLSARCRLWLVSIIAAVVAFGMVAAMVDFLASLAALDSRQMLLGFVRTRYAALVA